MSVTLIFYELSNPPDQVQQSFASASCVKAGRFSEAGEGIFEDGVVEIVSRSSPCLGTRTHKVCNTERNTRSFVSWGMGCDTLTHKYPTWMN